MHDKTGIRWLRVIVAGLLAEITVVLVIVRAIIVYKLAASPSDEQLQAAGGQVGFYVGIAGGALMSFLFALWVSRFLKSDFVVNGFLVGVFAASLHIILMLASGGGFQIAFIVADALKLAGGALGGFVAQKKFNQ